MVLLCIKIFVLKRILIKNKYFVKKLQFARLFQLYLSIYEFVYNIIKLI